MFIANESIFCNYLRYRQHFSFNSIIIIIGENRMGKSYFGCGLCENLDPNFNANKIVFDMETFLDFVDKAEPCWLLFDEVGCSLDRSEWWSTENRIFGQISEAYGKLGINLIMTLPSLGMLSRHGLEMSHFFIRMLSRGVARVYQNWKNPLTGQQHPFTIGHIVNLNPSKELWKAYEDKKMIFLNKKKTEWKQLYNTKKMSRLLTAQKIRNKVNFDVNPANQFSDSDAEQLES
jgi:hypothetical protein